MKKIITCLLAIILFSCCFTSCEPSYEENVFFADEFLIERSLENMPVPPHIDNSVMESGKILYLRLDESEYEQYVTDLLEYLRGKEDIYYLGYSVDFHYNNLFRANVIAPIKDNYDTSKNKHDFYFATENQLGGRSGNLLYSPVEICIIYEYGQLSYKGFEYNTKILIYNGVLANAEYDLCAAEHTYDEGVEYQIPASSKTIWEYTCVHCGSTELSEFIGNMKMYKITIEDTDADHHLIHRPTEGVSGVIYRIMSEKLDEGELKVTINGTEIIPIESWDGQYFTYAFVMPCEDIVITTEIVLAENK